MSDNKDGYQFKGIDVELDYSVNSTKPRVKVTLKDEKEKETKVFSDNAKITVTPYKGATPSEVPFMQSTLDPDYLRQLANYEQKSLRLRRDKEIAAARNRLEYERKQAEAKLEAERIKRDAERLNFPNPFTPNEALRWEKPALGTGYYTTNPLTGRLVPVSALIEVKPVAPKSDPYYSGIIDSLMVVPQADLDEDDDSDEEDYDDYEDEEEEDEDDYDEDEEEDDLDF